MNYRQAKIVLRTSIFLIVLGAAFGLYTCVRSGRVELLPVSDTPLVTNPQPTRSAPAYGPTPIYDYVRQFNDLNEAHLTFARDLGITPIRTNRDIMRETRPIVEMKSCKDFTISPLSHSYPFLVEPAALLLHDIGEAFNLKLEEHGGGDYKINVTSLLRTEESVNRLKRRNVNSTENSAHLYGTTFDISYVNFPEGEGNQIKQEEVNLKRMLAEVLLQMMNEGRCLVKYERKQGCFHITATGK